MTRPSASSAEVSDALGWDEAPRRVTRSSFAGLATNDDLRPQPVPGRGRGELAFDFPGVRVGTAEYAEGPTGVTVLEVLGGARSAVDARGGAVGLSGGYSFNHAICLAGGSVHGLAAATGVTDAILLRDGVRTGFSDLALVSGAVIYDFACRDNAVTPDNALGRAALSWAVGGRIPLGRVGAGSAATLGKMNPSCAEFAGQGAAYRGVGDIRILALTVVNAIGVAVGRDGSTVRGNIRPDGRRHKPGADCLAALAGRAAMAPAAGNTTLSVVVTNVRLRDADLAQVCRQVHSSMHRGIEPFHTSLDGDVMFMLTTDEIDLPRYSDTTPGELDAAVLGTVISDVMWDAIIESVR